MYDSLQMDQELRELRVNNDKVVANLSAQLEDQISVNYLLEDELLEEKIIKNGKSSMQISIAIICHYNHFATFS